MNRAEAQEGVVRAVAAGYRAGLEPFEIQDAVEFGAHEAGKLTQATLAGQGHLLPDVDHRKRICDDCGDDL